MRDGRLNGKMVLKLEDGKGGQPLNSMCMVVAKYGVNRVWVMQRRQGTKESEGTVLGNRPL